MAPPNVHKSQRYEDDLFPSRIVNRQHKDVPCYNFSSNAIYWHFFQVLDIDAAEETYVILIFFCLRWDISYIDEYYVCVADNDVVVFEADFVIGEENVAILSVFNVLRSL